MSNRTSNRRFLTFPRVALPAILTVLCSVTAVGQRAPAGVDLTIPVPTLVIEGEVRTSDNGPLPPDTMVRLEAEDGRPFSQQRVGGDGKFQFVNVRNGAYRLTATGAEYKTATETIDTTFGVAQEIVIHLLPVRTTAPSPQATVTDLAAPKRARREYEKGAREKDGGNLKEAQRHLEKAVGDDPCYARALTALGVTLTRQQQWSEAESAFRTSIKCDGGFLEGYLQLALLLWGQKKYEACTATLVQGLRQFPNEWRLHYHLGRVEQSLGDYPSAEQEYRKSAALNAAIPPAFHQQLADLYRNWKKYDEEQAELETYLRSDPNGQFAQPTRKRLQDLQASGLVSSVPGHTDQRKP